MRFLADESCDARVADALRDGGHDVVMVSKVARGAADSEVVALAVREGRVVLTEDRDFGRLVFAGGLAAHSGVLFVRCPERDRSTLPARIAALVNRLGVALEGSFVVWTPRRTRVRHSESG